jgi:hypothetical protein
VLVLVKFLARFCGIVIDDVVKFFKKDFTDISFPSERSWFVFAQKLAIESLILTTSGSGFSSK